MFRAFCAIFVYFRMKNLKNCLYGKYSDKNTKFNPNQNVEIYREKYYYNPTLQLTSGPRLLEAAEGCCS